MKRCITLTALAVVLLLAGCSTAPSEAGTTPPSTAPAGATTVQDVWTKIGCDENGILDATPPKPPIQHTGMCTPYEGGELAFFYQLPSAEAAADWLASGELEIGATDAVFTDGPVVILATDAGSAQKFGELFTPYK